LVRSDRITFSHPRLTDANRPFVRASCFLPPIRRGATAPPSPHPTCWRELTLFFEITLLGLSFPLFLALQNDVSTCFSCPLDPLGMAEPRSLFVPTRSGVASLFFSFFRVTTEAYDAFFPFLLIRSGFLFLPQGLTGANFLRISHGVPPFFFFFPCHCGWSINRDASRLNPLFFPSSDNRDPLDSHLQSSNSFPFDDGLGFSSPSPPTRAASLE